MKKVSNGWLVELRKGTYRPVWNKDKTDCVYVKNKRFPDKAEDAAKVDIGIPVVDDTSITDYDAAISFLENMKK